MADVAITVGSTKYPLKVINYQKVDITDFAPKSFTSSQTHSTMGLYTDATQEGWGHGFGAVEFKEPQQYHYSGHLVDTRHNFIGLWTSPTTTSLSGVMVLKAIVRNSVVFCTTSGDGLYAQRPSTSAFVEAIALTSSYDLLDTGPYVLLTSSQRMKAMDGGKATSGTTELITIAGMSWVADYWVLGGSVYVFDGTGVGYTGTVITNTATTIQVSPAVGTPFDSTTCFVVSKDTGSAVNQPTAFRQMAVFGGNYWAYEANTNRLHFWAEDDGSDAEGGASDAGKVMVGSVTRGLGIVNMIPFQNQLWIFRRDGAWTINEQDADTLAYHTLDFSAETHASNFLTVLVWQGFLCFSIRNRLYKYRSGLQDITPPVWDLYPPYKQYGIFKGLTARGKYLYVLGFSNEANSDEALETTTGFGTVLCHDGVGWHRLMDFPNGTPPFTHANMWYTPTTDKLYVHARTAGGSWMWDIQLQTNNDLPYASFPTSGNHYLYTSYYDFTYKRVSKSFASVTLHGNFPTNTSVVVAYRVDSTTSWTTLGTFDSDYETVAFATGVTGTRIQFRLNLQTTTATSTPIVQALVVKLMMRPTVLYGIYCDVQVSSDLTNAQQRVLGLTSREIETALLAARDSVAPITFSDLAGTDHTAYLASVKFRMAEYADAEGLQYIAQCTLVFV